MRLAEHRVDVVDVDVHGHRRTAERLRREEPVVGELVGEHHQPGADLELGVADVVG